jgi:hypothetical protein
MLIPSERVSSLYFSQICHGIFDNFAEFKKGNDREYQIRIVMDDQWKEQ